MAPGDGDVALRPDFAWLCPLRLQNLMATREPRAPTSPPCFLSFFRISSKLMDPPKRDPFQSPPALPLWTDIGPHQMAPGAKWHLSHLPLRPCGGTVPAYTGRGEPSTQWTGWGGVPVSKATVHTGCNSQALCSIPSAPPSKVTAKEPKAALTCGGPLTPGSQVRRAQ